MFVRIILTALAAGLISGVFVWGAHMVKTAPLILAAEVYEDQAAGHQPTPASAEQTLAAQPEEEWAPADGIERGAFTLDPGRADDGVCVRVSAPQYVDDVADGGTVERRDDANLAGKRGKGTLAARVEQALGREAFLELVEGQLQRTEPFRLEMLADDLILTFRVVDADPAACHDA